MLGPFFQFLGFLDFDCYVFSLFFLALSLNSSFIAIWALSFLFLLICFLLSSHCKTSRLRFLGLCMVYLIWVVCWLTNLVGKTASAKLGWSGQLQFLAYQSGQKRSFFYRFPMVIPVVGNSSHGFFFWIINSKQYISGLLEEHGLFMIFNLFRNLRMPALVQMSTSLILEFKVWFQKMNTYIPLYYMPLCLYSCNYMSQLSVFHKSRFTSFEWIYRIQFP